MPKRWDGYLSVRSRSNEEVEAIASACRSEADTAAPNIIECILGVAAKFKASHGLTIHPVPDHELGGDEARATSAVPPTIKVRQSVFHAAQRNSPRARFTLAHEFGHIILEHKGEYRARNAATATVLHQEKAYADAEHQANLFAAAFLIPNTVENSQLSPSGLQIRFGVSKAAAEIRAKQFSSRKARALPDDVVEAIRRQRSNASLQGRTEPTISFMTSAQQAMLLFEILPIAPGEDRDWRLVDNRWCIRRGSYGRMQPGGWRIVDGVIVAWDDEASS